MHVTELQKRIYALMTEIGDSNFGLIVADTFDHFSANTVLSREGAVLISSLHCHGQRGVERIQERDGFRAVPFLVHP